jgi:CheY-like chemotaxis protein
MGKGIVLVVDDDPSILEFLKAALEDEGYGVLTAVDGEALYAVRHDPPPDVIVLDIQMLGMDGVEVCQRLRSQPGTADIPIIVMSAQHRLSAVAPGMPINDWLPKPIDLERLYAAVARWISD